MHTVPAYIEFSAAFGRVQTSHEQIASSDNPRAAPPSAIKTLTPSSDEEIASVVDLSNIVRYASTFILLEEAVGVVCCEEVAPPRYIHDVTVFVHSIALLTSSILIRILDRILAGFGHASCQIRLVTMRLIRIDRFGLYEKNFKLLIRIAGKKILTDYSVDVTVGRMGRNQNVEIDGNSQRPQENHLPCRRSACHFNT